MIHHVKKVIQSGSRYFAIIDSMDCKGCYLGRRGIDCGVECRNYGGKFRLIKDWTSLKMTDGSVKRFRIKDNHIRLEDVNNERLKQ